MIIVNILGQLGLAERVVHGIVGEDLWLQSALRHLLDHLANVLGQLGLGERVDAGICR